MGKVKVPIQGKSKYCSEKRTLRNETNSGKMQENGPGSEKYSPASFGYFLVSDHCLMFSTFPIPLKQMPPSQFPTIVRPLTLPLDSSIHVPTLF